MPIIKNIIVWRISTVKPEEIVYVFFFCVLGNLQWMNNTAAHVER